MKYMDVSTIKIKNVNFPSCFVSMPTVEYGNGNGYSTLDTSI